MTRCFVTCPYLPPKLPYSEHSSYNELVNFVSWLQPVETVPSVGNDGGGPKAKKMLELLKPQPQQHAVQRGTGGALQVRLGSVFKSHTGIVDTLGRNIGSHWALMCDPAGNH